VNNVKRKICVTTGTRAEYGLLKPLMFEIQKNPKLDLKLIFAGMHLSQQFGSTIKEIKHDGFKISGIVKMVPNGNENFDMSIALAEGIKQFSKIFKKIQPDINIILGDRDEPYASAIAAFHMNIPNAHLHGGEKSQAGIDEYIRHSITKISNIHFAATKKSYNRIKKLGENPKYIFQTGSTGIDEIFQNNITSKMDLEKKYNLKFVGNEILLLQHSVTTKSNKSKYEITQTLNALKKLKIPTIAIYPNSDAGHQEIFDMMNAFAKNNKFFKIYSSIPRNDYLGFLENCKILLGNSSSGVIEASYFDISVINIGIRQKDRERGTNVIDVNHSSIEIFDIIKKIIFSRKKIHYKNSKIYGNGDASKKIVDILTKIKINDDIIQKQIHY